MSSPPADPIAADTTDCTINSERVEAEYQFSTFIVDPETGAVGTIGENGQPIPGIQFPEGGDVRLWTLPVCVYAQADEDNADAPTKRNLLDVLAVERAYHASHNETYTADPGELSALAPDLFGAGDDPLFRPS